MEHSSFNYGELEDLESDIQKMGLSIPLLKNLDILRQPVYIGDKRVENRLAIHPMEGCDGLSDGKPGKLTFRRYERFAAGGAALLWMEAAAVQYDGRANPRQLFICKDNKFELQKLLETIYDAAQNKEEMNFKPYTVMQLTHSGRYSRPKDKPAPIIAASNPYLDKFLPDQYSVITDDELERLEDSYVEAATIARDIGFDAVDIKSCHRYLVSELLSSYTREGKYGGSFENRTRFLLNVIDKIKDRLGTSIDIAVRLNVYDAIPYPYGWGVDKQDFQKVDMGEPIKLIKLLYARDVKLVNITMGNPYYNPHVGRPYNMGPYIPPEHPLEGIARLLDAAQCIQKEVPKIHIVSTGYSWLRHFAPYVAAGGIEKGWFSMAGFGRQAFAYPDFAYDIFQKDGMISKKCCTSCGKCTEIMRNDSMTGCVVRDPEVYATIYKSSKKGRSSGNIKKVSNHI